jgi:hypothetical protein
MHGSDRFAGLEFNDDDVFNQEVDSITDFKFDGLVDDWEWHLGLDPQASFAQLVEQARLIGALKKAWPKR